VPQLQRPLLDSLQEALEAHRYALNLDQENPDTLFNTAQVLTAIAETLAKNPYHADQDALQPLEEALELQNRCLAVQEMKLEESKVQQQEAEASIASQSYNDDIEPGGVIDSQSEDDGSTAVEDKWFSVVEPITEDTLVDTIVAQLGKPNPVTFAQSHWPHSPRRGQDRVKSSFYMSQVRHNTDVLLLTGTLTTLCSLIGPTVSVPRTTLTWVDDYATNLISNKLPTLLSRSDPERLEEVALARANLMSELLKAGFLMNSIDADTYKLKRDEAFQMPDLRLEQNYGALIANAASLVAFNTVMAESANLKTKVAAASRWSVLSAAIASAAAASKLANILPEDIAETHFIRGNCSLLQYQLGQPPISHATAVSNSSQLLKNANTFYGNASKLYQNEEQKVIARFRALVIQHLQAGSNDFSGASFEGSENGPDWTRAQLEEMVEDGLISTR
jgi:hypothetical protein